MTGRSGQMRFRKGFVDAIGHTPLIRLDVEVESTAAPPIEDFDITLLATEGTVVNLSRQRREGGRVLGMPVAPDAARALHSGDALWLFDVISITGIW